MGPSEAIKSVDKYIVEKEYTEDEIALRKAFVQEYMKHRNAYRACLELGFLATYAQDWAKAFMHEGLVRRLISAAERVEDTEEAALERRRRYRALMEHEATYYGPGASHSSRVAAIAHLMKIEGMEPEKKPDPNEVPGGVMVVPAITDPDTWSKLAAKSQEKLKSDVKE